jgi:hypothetical protein
LFQVGLIVFQLVKNFSFLGREPKCSLPLSQEPTRWNISFAMFVLLCIRDLSSSNRGSKTDYAVEFCTVHLKFLQADAKMYRI